VERKKMRDVNVGEREREMWNESGRLGEKKRECGKRERKKGEIETETYKRI
jgi:hypothetical protein